MLLSGRNNAVLLSAEQLSLRAFDVQGGSEQTAASPSLARYAPTMFALWPFKVCDFGAESIMSGLQRKALSVHLPGLLSLRNSPAKEENDIQMISLTAIFAPAHKHLA